MKLFQKAKKSLGQNFLIDNNIINKIVKIGNVDKNKTVMEIGAGYGSLTKAIAYEKPKKIFAIEKDKKLVLFLKNKFKNHNNIKLASLILLKKWPPWYGILILMFQKEVAERIMAKTQTKEYNRLAVLSNWRLEIKKHFNVSNNCFFPKPKITSTVLSFIPKKNNQFSLKDPKNLEKITRVLFSNRRKMINKNFNKLFEQNQSVSRNLNINLNKRPEELSNEMFYKIAAQYEKLSN